MAEQGFTLESVRLFMIERGGSCTNHELVARFKTALNDPVKKLENRNKFKDFVHLLASVENKNGEKHLVLKKRYQEAGCLNLYHNKESSSPAPQGPSDISSVIIPEPFNTPDPPSRPTSQQSSKIYPVQAEVDPTGFSGGQTTNASYPVTGPKHTAPSYPGATSSFDKPDLGFYSSIASRFSTSSSTKRAEIPEESASIATISSGANLSAAVAAPPVPQGGIAAPHLPISDVSQPTAPVPFGSTTAPFGSTAAPFGSTAAPFGSTAAPFGSTAAPFGSTAAQAPVLGNAGSASTALRTRPISPDVSTPDRKADDSLRRTPISAKDRIKQFDAISTENDAVKPYSTRTKIRESRMQHITHNDNSEDPDTGSISIVSLNAQEKQWMIVSAACDYQQIFKLLKDHSDLAHRRDFINGYNGMHWAAKHGKPDVIKLLHGYQVDVNVHSHCGYSPLHLAAMGGHEECIDLLVNLCQAKPNTRDFYGKRPKQYLKRNCSTRIQQMLQGAAKATFSGGQFLAPAASDDSSNFGRTQSFSQKVKRTTQAIASRFIANKLSHSSEDVKDGIDGLPTPESSPSLKRKNSISSTNSTNSSRFSTVSCLVSSQDSMPPPSSQRGSVILPTKYQHPSYSDPAMHRSESTPEFVKPSSTSAY